MLIFYIILGLGVGGIGFVLWNLKNEQKHEEIFAEMEQETTASRSQVLNQIGIEPKASKVPAPAPAPEPKKSLFSKLPLGKMLKKSNSADDTVNPYDPFNDIKNQKADELLHPIQETGTAALRISSPSKPEALDSKKQKEIDEEINLSLEHGELKEKYEKLDKLFQEKSSELERVQKSLDQELKNRKEFNKVKDILEKEIKDVRDKLKEAQAETANSLSEGERHKKRIAQLEEKVTQLEKDNLSKESQIEDLNRKPSKKEPIKEEIKAEPAKEPEKIEPIVEAAEQQIMQEIETPKPNPVAVIASEPPSPAVIPQEIPKEENLTAAEPPPRSNEEESSSEPEPEETAGTGLSLRPDIMMDSKPETTQSPPTETNSPTPDPKKDQQHPE